jgi:hypothetical protein
MKLLLVFMIAFIFFSLCAKAQTGSTPPKKDTASEIFFSERQLLTQRHFSPLTIKNQNLLINSHCYSRNLYPVYSSNNRGQDLLNATGHILVSILGEKTKHAH